MKAQVFRYKIPSAILLSTAVSIEERLNLSDEESADIEAASGEQDGAAQPGGEQDNFVNHLTASLYGPDEICTSAGRRRLGTAARPERAGAAESPGRRRGYG